MKEELQHLAASIKKAAALPDQVAELLRGMILSGTFTPGQRIVETRIARELGIGQPTVREALGKLEEAGLVVRSQHAGCTVTQLTRKEYSEIFRVRTEMECLAVELAVENLANVNSSDLKASLHALKEAARSKSVEEFYRADIRLHRAIWKLANNGFLEKALSQMVVPLFAFAMIEIIARPEFDLIQNAREHEKLVKAILTLDKTAARRVAKQMLGTFWEEGLSLIHEDASAPSGKKSTRTKRQIGSMRLVPVSLFIDGHVEDAGVYLAQPVPFALQTGDVYSIERAGQSAPRHSKRHQPRLGDK